MAYSPTTILYDNATLRYSHIDLNGQLLVSQTKRILGSNNLTAPDLFTTTPTNGGTAVMSVGVTTMATNTTENGAIDIKSIRPVRFQFGRNSVWSSLIRFGDTGTANNVREFGLYIDANNSFGFRLSGTTFSIFVTRNGSTTAINSGAFNGNGNATGGSWTVDTNFHLFTLEYFNSRIIFYIDETAVHSYNIMNVSLVSSLTGQAYFNNTNSGGGTTNVTMDCGGVRISRIGAGNNNPQFYCNNAVAETRTLKGSAGTLHSVMISSSAGANALLQLFDNTAGSGTLIGRWDLNATASVGNFQFDTDGVEFSIGLTYVTSGTMTNGSFTVMWD